MRLLNSDKGFRQHPKIAKNCQNYYIKSNGKLKKRFIRFYFIFCSGQLVINRYGGWSDF
jgi:hypothetical protein